MRLRLRMCHTTSVILAGRPEAVPYGGRKASGAVENTFRRGGFHIRPRDVEDAVPYEGVTGDAFAARRVVAPYEPKSIAAAR